mgnify:CR=1 FL=1
MRLRADASAPVAANRGARAMWSAAARGEAAAGGAEEARAVAVERAENELHAHLDLGSGDKDSEEFARSYEKR